MGGLPSNTKYHSYLTGWQRERPACRSLEFWQMLVHATITIGRNNSPKTSDGIPTSGSGEASRVASRVGTLGNVVEDLGVGVLFPLGQHAFHHNSSLSPGLPYQGRLDESHSALVGSQTLLIDQSQDRSKDGRRQ